MHAFTVRALIHLRCSRYVRVRFLRCRWLNTMQYRLMYLIFQTYQMLAMTRLWFSLFHECRVDNHLPIDAHSLLMNNSLMTSLTAFLKVSLLDWRAAVRALVLSEAMLMTSHSWSLSVSWNVWLLRLFLLLQKFPMMTSNETPSQQIGNTIPTIVTSTMLVNKGRKLRCHFRHEWSNLCHFLYWAAG